MEHQRRRQTGTHRAHQPAAGWAANLFGEKGSYLCFTCAQEAPAYIAQQIGAKNVAILAYTAPQSAQCAQGMEAGFRSTASTSPSTTATSQFGFTDLGSDIDR